MALRVLKQKPSKKGSKRVPKKHRTNGPKLGKAHSFRTPKREINPVIALTSLEENYNYPIVCSNLGGVSFYTQVLSKFPVNSGVPFFPFEVATPTYGWFALCVGEPL